MFRREHQDHHFTLRNELDSGTRYVREMGRGFRLRTSRNGVKWSCREHTPLSVETTTETDATGHG